MRVYNRHGRRDNKYKARIKILVTELGEAEFTRQVDAEFAAQRGHEKIDLPQAEIDRINAYFAPPKFSVPAKAEFELFEVAKKNYPDFRITSYNVCYTKLLRVCGSSPSLMPAPTMPAI